MPAPAPVNDEEEKTSQTSTDEKTGDDSENSSKIDTSEFQAGAQKVQAINQVWSKNHLITAYVL
jgi:hypothetical protein